MNRNNSKQQKPQIKEEFAVVLDIITNPGKYSDSLSIQAIGTTTFTLLELVPKPGVEIKNGASLYIGDGKREEIQFIKKALKIEELTPSAKAELEFIIQDIINQREKEFINFLNNTGPITIRKHSLELIPGIGKKHLNELLDERFKPFESFEDLKKRCGFFSDPQKAISHRIIKELEDPEEFKLFTRK